MFLFQTVPKIYVLKGIHTFLGKDETGVARWFVGTTPFGLTSFGLKALWSKNTLV
jgi:hypothetical protein